MFIRCVTSQWFGVTSWVCSLRAGLWSRSRWCRMFSAGVGVRNQSRFSKLLESESGVGFLKLLESESGVGFLKLLESESVFQNCWSRSRFFKTAGVGVGFSKLLESESVFQNCWSLSRFFKTAGVGVGFSKLLESESEHLLQLPTPMFIK